MKSVLSFSITFLLTFVFSNIFSQEKNEKSIWMNQQRLENQILEFAKFGKDEWVAVIEVKFDKEIVAN